MLPASARPRQPEALVFRNLRIERGVAAEYWRRDDKLTAIVYAFAENCRVNDEHRLPWEEPGELVLELVFSGVSASCRGVASTGMLNLPHFEDFVPAEEVLLPPGLCSPDQRPLGLPAGTEGVSESYRIYEQYGFWREDEGQAVLPTASLHCVEQFNYLTPGKSFCGDFIWDIRARSAYANLVDVLPG